jgi:hypothetical protein
MGKLTLYFFYSDTKVLLFKRKQELGIQICLLETQDVLDHSILSWVFQHLVFVGVDTEKLAWVSGFCPVLLGGLSSHCYIAL